VRATPSPTHYTVRVTEPPPSAEDKPSLRTDQVAQTRAALVAAARRLFGRDGFAATSVDEIAREARLTTGALYHHFPNKMSLFEAVFEAVHADLLEASLQASVGAADEVELLTRGFDAFFDAVLEPDVQRIIILDAPAVLGLARFTELDEQYAFAAITSALQAATVSGRLRVDDPETLARLLLGSMTRGAMLIANSSTPRSTRDAVARTLRALLEGMV